MLKNLHIFLQGKGGVGKSFCASMLAQYLRSRLPSDISPEEYRRHLLLWDSDPNNHTLSSFKALNVDYVDLVNNGQNVSIQAYDKFFELINVYNLSSSDAECSAILDTGSSNFIQTVNFLDRNDGLDIMQEEYGVNVFIHCPIFAGTASYNACWFDFDQMCSRFQNVNFILWINNYKEFVFTANHKIGSEPMYAKNRKRIAAVIDLPFLDYDTPNRAVLEFILNRFLTFDEVQFGATVTGPDGSEREFSRLEVRRAAKVRSQIFDAISVINGVI